MTSPNRVKHGDAEIHGSEESGRLLIGEVGRGPVRPFRSETLSSVALCEWCEKRDQLMDGAQDDFPLVASLNLGGSRSLGGGYPRSRRSGEL